MRRLVTIIVLIGVSVSARAQFSVPPFDVEIKGGISGFPTSKWDYMGIGYKAGVHVHLNQHVAIGWTYMRSTGNASEDSGDNIFPTEDFKTTELSTGPSLRLSTGRSRKMRPYIALSYSKVEVVTDRGDYRYSIKTNAPGASVGMLVKLGNKMYINLFEVTYRKLSDKVFWLDAQGQLEIKAGLLYNLGKKK